MNASLKHVAMVWTAMLFALVGLAGFGKFYTTAAAMEAPETGKIYFAADCDKTELFRTRPAPGAILPGEHGYDHDNHEIVATRPDGTIVFKNSVVIHPDGSFEIPEGYSDPVEHDGWREIYTSQHAITYWNNESGHWDIEYGPAAMEGWMEFRPHPEPYVSSDGEVHVPGSPDYHPELEALWGFVPDALKPEGWQVGIPWPEPLDWSVLDQEPVEQPEPGTEWNSVTVFDRWIDGTKVFGNGLILHPNGVFHLPADWQSVTEDGTTREAHVYFDPEIGEWSVYYTALAAPIEAPDCWNLKDDNEQPPAGPELAEPPVAEDTESGSDIEVIALDEPESELEPMAVTTEAVAEDEPTGEAEATGVAAISAETTDVEVTGAEAIDTETTGEVAQTAASAEALNEVVETTTAATDAAVAE